MKKIVKNESGMTLVEIIVAMALLGVMSSMFVTTAVFASRSNANNYNRDKEMHAQAVDAAQYNDHKTYEVYDLKVNKNNAAGTNSNQFTLKADFGGGIVWETKTNGFKAKRNNYQKGTSYQLKFFDSGSLDIKPDPTKGIYWIRYYNDSGTDMLQYVNTPETVGGRFFDVNSNTAGNEMLVNTPTGGKAEFGIVVTAGQTDIFGFSENGDLYTDDHIMTENDHKFTSTDFEKFLEVDAEGNKTGFVVIHYNGGDEYLNQAEYEASLDALPPDDPDADSE